MKSLKQLLSEEVVKQAIPVLRKIVILVAGVVAFLFIQAQFKDKNTQLSQQIEQIKQFKLDAEKTSKYADSLNRIVLVKEQEAGAADARARVLGTQVGKLKRETATLRGAADSLKETITDSIELARRVIPLQDSIISHQDSTIAKQDTQIVNLTIAGAKKDTTITLLKLSRDSLQTIINKAPEPPKNPNKLFGFINLPSRKTTAIVSGIAGALAALVLVK